MKINKKMTELLKSRIVLIAVLCLIAVILIGVYFLKSYNKEEKLDTTYIISELQKASELVTAKLKYTGMSEYKDSGIVGINRSDFIMVYEATAQAGINIADVKVYPNDFEHVVWVSIPKADIMYVKVDPSTIRYFNEKMSLFNVDEKEDANKAQVLAEEAATDELRKMGILEMADGQAEALIKGLIQDVVPNDYEIKIKRND